MKIYLPLNLYQRMVKKHAIIRSLGVVVNDTDVIIEVCLCPRLDLVQQVRFVGINIGTEISNMPPTTAVVDILKAQKITHVRLFDPNYPILNALADTGIEVMVGVTNKELSWTIAPRAAEWINRNVAAFLPSTNITAIAVGNEVLTSILVPALKNLQCALLASNISNQVKISTPHSMNVIPVSFPPSTAIFNVTTNVMKQLLQFLEKTDSYLMLNAYPYFGYVNGNGIFPLDYALFHPLPPSKQIVDANTLSHYNSMFDAMVDAAYYSMEALNFTGISIVVTETGWPWLGGANEQDANMENAQEYNKNLIRQVLNGSGTPSQPNMPVSAYIFELFNEDLRPGPISEKNWGLSYSNGTAVYSLGLSTNVNQVGVNTSTGIGIFCVARNNATSDSLVAGINWACGAGNANCSAIQVGQPCYEPNTPFNHASYAYNDYYHRTITTGGTCDFGGSALLTSSNPSYGSCIFAGSSNGNTTSGGLPFAPGPDGFDNRASRMQLCKSVLLLSSLLLYIL